MRTSPSGDLDPRAVLPFGSHAVPGGASNTFTYAVPGAKLGQSVIVNPSTSEGLGPLLIAYSTVSGPGEVAVTYYNPNESPVQPTDTVIIVCCPVG